MATRYVHNYKAFGDEVLRAGWMVAEMRTRAEAVMAAAKAIAPVGDPRWGWYRDGGSNAVRPGNYRDSFSVNSGVHAHGAGARAYGRVSNSASYAGIVEYGYGRVPKHRVLGRALSAANAPALAGVGA